MLKLGSFALLVGGTVALGASAAFAANACGENALGTGRTIAVSTSEFPRIGTEQYQETLRLKDHEVVLTFDAGPHREHTSRVLAALAGHCVKATFFMLGSHVAEAPHPARRAREEGHSVGTSTFSHVTPSQVPLEKAQKEIELGIEVLTEALGKGNSPAPFFRAPYLGITKEVEKFLYSRGLMVWGIDADSLDWTFADSSRLIEHSIAALEKNGKGILLLHDIKPATARALPVLFSELKRRGFRIVHVVPESNPAPDASNISRLAHKKPRD